MAAQTPTQPDGLSPTPLSVFTLVVPHPERSMAGPLFSGVPGMGPTRRYERVPSFLLMPTCISCGIRAQTSASKPAGHGNGPEIDPSAGNFAASVGDAVLPPLPVLSSSSVAALAVVLVVFVVSETAGSASASAGPGNADMLCMFEFASRKPSLGGTR